MKYLICGLGNPGIEYELTRHNAGFLVLDRLADKIDSTFTPSRHASKSEIKYKGRKIILIKPATYMNLSGKAVRFWLKEEKVAIENLLVITDDIALPFGKLRMRANGSSAGHNGLGNIEETLGNNNYSRLRFGVGNEFNKGQQVDYVLSNFSPEETDGLVLILDKACDAILSFCTIGINRTMNIFN
ncbi:MAG: aminoacyl-tRNA hydrolase [Bacteroidetes bacterium]|nr:aminoacyl-tRNA hydrolase [Bacteroidota bacterium]MDA1120020.1 aminoacyl-tRNA hydrolase [Bacteroidota bacterium]